MTGQSNRDDSESPKSQDLPGFYPGRLLWELNTISQREGLHSANYHQEDKIIKWKRGGVNEKRAPPSTSLSIKSQQRD